MKKPSTLHKFTTVTALCCSLAAHADDFLGGDDFAFDSSALEVNESSWTDGFKTALEHSHTQIPGDASREQSSVRVVYEGNVAEGVYLKVDNRYRYFWHNDDLAENRGDAYGHNKLQRAWLQYSRGACSSTLGRQTLIWGTVEGTFVTDIVTPFDYTEQLLTDYGSVRLAQDMLVGECFSSQSQLQVFYTPEARTDIYQHHPLIVDIAPGFPRARLDIDPEEEWGLRYKWLGDGYDLSLMYARLYDNNPTPMLRGNSDAGPSPADIIGGALGQITGDNAIPEGYRVEPALAQFNLVGAASAIAIGRLLLKVEAAYRSEQLIAFSDDTTERYDAAVGFEYTTTSNHIINAGIWGTHLSNDAIAVNDTQVLSLGWRKTFLNDNLVMSLLGNWSSNPRFASATILADYRWNDYWSTAFAISAADLGELGENNPIVAAEESATMSIKYEF